MVEDSSTSLPGPLQNGSVYLVVVVVLAVLAALGAVLALGGSTDELLWAIAAGVGLSVVVALTYQAGRRFGQPHSHATATAAVIFGVGLLAGVITELLRASEILTDAEIGLGLLGAVVATVVIIGLIGAVDRMTAAG